MSGKVAVKQKTTVTWARYKHTGWVITPLSLLLLLRAVANNNYLSNYRLMSRVQNMPPVWMPSRRKALDSFVKFNETSGSTGLFVVVPFVLFLCDSRGIGPD